MKFITKISPFIALLFFVSACQQEDVFEIPNSVGLEENASLSALMSEIESGQKNVVS